MSECVHPGQIRHTIRRDPMVVEPSYSECGCILGSSRISSELSDLARRVLSIFCLKISRALIVLEPSYSESGCILGSSRMSSEMSDLDLIFHGHFVPDAC